MNDRTRVADLFAAAVTRTGEERAAFLDAECAGSQALRAEVESLLRAYDDSDGFLEPFDVRRLATLMVEGGAPPLPAAIGPYRIVRELGRGGQGRVFLGERADGQFEQQVAVKLLRAGLDSPDAMARFRRERQILARLRHPAIAALLDGGVTEDGQPWFAMECVEGTSITAFCEAQGLDLAARLRLFVEVADAVAYAHRHNVVHRDLKPSNILVTNDGHAKLVDFGIAKPLEDGTPAVTRTAARVLTPEYAAPEQVRGAPVTAASDVYSLGAVLYELLTGERVHRLASYSPVEIAHVVCEQEPVAPSRAARKAGTPRLRSDLDAIVLKALRKEPEGRYASVDDLIGDLDRYQRGLPVRARRGSALYRARKLVARHRVRFAILVLVVGLGGALAALSSRARAAAREAERAREMENYARALREGLPTAPGTAGAAAVPASAAGRRLVYMSNRGGKGFGIYASDGDSAVLVIDNAAQPAWSPDGTRLVFERDGDLYTAAGDGRDERQITQGPDLDREPAWSPDGRRIAFRSNRGGDISDVWVVNADGSDARNLTRHPGFDGQPAWSPDGTRIAFNTNRDGNYEIYVMNADGSAPVNLTRHPLLDIEPVWSPDGRHIAFPSLRDGNYEVYVMNADGSGAVNLTHHPAADGQPAWSPDGTMIAFVSDRLGNGEIYVMSADGRLLANVSRSPADEAWPAWRR